MRSENAKVRRVHVFHAVVTHRNRLSWRKHHVALHPVERLAYHPQRYHYDSQMHDVAAVAWSVRGNQPQESDGRIVAGAAAARYDATNPLGYDASGDQGAQCKTDDSIGLANSRYQQNNHHAAATDPGSISARRNDCRLARRQGRRGPTPIKSTNASINGPLT